MINMDYVMGFLKAKGEEEKPKKGGMIMVITVAKPKKSLLKTRIRRNSLLKRSIEWSLCGEVC